MLGDVDRQQSSREWLRLRPSILPTIRSWEIEPGKNRQTTEGHHARRPRHAGRPARQGARHGRQAGESGPRSGAAVAVRHSRDAPFSRGAAGRKAVRNEQAFVAVVGMRVDPRTRAAAELERFLAQYDLPVLTHLRTTQLYVQTTMHGMTMFDLSASRAAKDLEQWQADHRLGES
jgi:chromosome partitioning protein